MDVRLDGRRILITGGTRGIGRAIALACAAAGADVAINYARQDRPANETAAAITALGRRCVLLKGDAAAPEFGAKLVKQAIADLGGLDTLINNAGISHNVPFLALEAEEWTRAVQVNVDSLFAITQPFLKHLVKKKQPGRILNLTSLCGVRPMAAVPVHYATTKAAIVGFTYTLAKEVGRYGVTVNAIAPGLIETAFSINLPAERQEDFRRFCPAGRVGKPEEIAHLAVFMLSDFNSYMSGETVVVSGGL